MGAFIDIGVKPLDSNYGNRSLDIGLNRSASNSLEILFDEALQEKHPKIHETIMAMLCLDQISFTDLNTIDFNISIQAIRDCIAKWNNLTELQFYQKKNWEELIEPLIQQDERYQKN